jgi:GNAT superfamily N-acetyltransferase
MPETSTPAIHPLRPGHLPQVLSLVNAHLQTALPGFGLTEAALARTLVDEPGQHVINPWVAERGTLCALEDDRVVAAAHVLRYADEPRVWGRDYRDTADLAWLLAWPAHKAAGVALAEAAMARIRAWRPRHVTTGDFGLPVPVLKLVPESWPHVTEVLTAVGFERAADPDESVYACPLDAVPPAGDPPIPGLTATRTVGDFGPRFTARLAGDEVGHCEWELPPPGDLRALARWAELGDLGVEEPWRDRGIGAWLVRHSAQWLRLAGCDRILLAVTPSDDAAGAGRFYRRLGLERLSRAWPLGPHPDWPAPAGRAAALG